MITFTFTGFARLGFTSGSVEVPNMATSTTASYERVRSGLTGAIRSTRQDCPPGETARLLLSFDTATTALIGMSFDGGRVVFHDRTSDQAIACRFDTDGPIRGSGVRIAKLSDGSTISRWVRKMGPAYWVWLHPRYRDAFDHP